MKNLQVFLKAPVILMLVLSFILSSCAAVNLPTGAESVLTYTIYSIGQGTVAYGINQALSDKVGTEVLIKDSMLLFTWAQEGVGTAMFGINMADKKPIDVFKAINDGGQILSFRSASDLKTWMLNNGWKVITGAEIGAAMKATLLSAIEIATSPLLALYMVVPSDWDGSSLPDPLAEPVLQ